LSTLLDRILEPGGLSVRFEPILDVVTGEPRLHYLEGLIRGPRGTTVEAPDILFEYARKKGSAAVVDRACIAAILSAARALPHHAAIGFNVHASTLALDPEFLVFLGDEAATAGIEPSRIIVEIVEHAPPWDVAGFRNVLDGLRAIGARIALDDVGLGHSNFLMILECRPNYFKIDRYFVDGCRSDFHRQAVLRSVANLAQPFGAKVVAEGVERAADLDTLHGLGIDLVQGRLYGPSLGVDEALAQGLSWRPRFPCGNGAAC
jgi:EAL domain-containing protein (putative c-di-GMP-specific phosphodiesterase class I)